MIGKQHVFTLLLFCLLVSAPSTKVFAQYTPGGLFSLARAGDIEGLKAILDKKPNQFLLDSALEAAVIGRQVEAISLLHEHGANINYINPKGTAILVNAIMLGFYDSASTLIDLGADPNVNGYFRLYHGYKMNWHWNALMAASYQGNLEMVKKLIDAGANIDAQGYSVSEKELESAADIAAYSGHLHILQYLLTQKARFNPDSIYSAARGGHLEIVDYLLNNGHDINAPGPNYHKTLLMEASWWGHLNIVDYLIEHGADIKKTDDNGYTALSDAAANDDNDINDRIEIIKMLISKGADVRREADYKMTPLMRAKDPKVIELLVEAGAR